MAPEVANRALRTMAMAAFLFRCPATGLNVQGWSAEDPTRANNEGYESVSCLACRRIHLINPKTGEVLSPET
jgi:hypothetical protein